MPRENVSQARDLKIRMIRERLKHSGTADARNELERMLAELLGEIEPVAKGTLRPQKAPVEAKPTPTLMEPQPKLTVKVWTPDGEVEVVREEPGYILPSKDARTDTGGTTTDIAERDNGPGVPEPLEERLKTADRTKTKPPTVLGERTGAEDGGRKPTREEERLMLLTGIKDLDALNRFLNAPSLPPE
jgi:hypothetical protein